MSLDKRLEMPFGCDFDEMMCRMTLPAPLRANQVFLTQLSNKFIIVFYSANVHYSSLTSVHIK